MGGADRVGDERREVSPRGLTGFPFAEAILKGTKPCQPEERFWIRRSKATNSEAMINKLQTVQTLIRDTVVPFQPRG